MRNIIAFLTLVFALTLATGTTYAKKVPKDSTIAAQTKAFNDHIKAERAEFRAKIAHEKEAAKLAAMTPEERATYRQKRDAKNAKAIAKLKDQLAKLTAQK